MGAAEAVSPEVALIFSSTVPTTWAVEAIHMDADGACERAVFSGPCCETAARAYARWRYPTVKAEILAV